MIQPSVPFLPTRRAFLGAGLCFGALGFAGQAMAATKAQRLVAAARRQIGVTLRYDPAYTVLSFPNGDVDRVKGVCTDVVIRAFRDALALDLQALVNADMRANFGAYPKNWGLGRPDRNIDHRRVPNLATFWRRQKAAVPVSDDPADWRPGDIFTQRVGGRLPHTSIVSDRKNTVGVPLVIHNIGGGTREEDALFAHPLTGHFRWKV
ncbi:DUF1287 domain-containing protein [Sphingopyxis sp.]|uniref:DUF1287 domain-containing protein n=1 Tax=Sphingopyxis sp. TaxID=1908224 RepID=UPI00260628E0|nr:DUF1287 domain-containing protein [Sphingopyxis sp.]MCW0199326.1 DUF1287 domain-containing protein [Sphingopyxis sp.]